MADGSAADKAYQAALREIERVRAAGGGPTGLFLSHNVGADLDRIPPEIAALKELRFLVLDGTKVSDLSLLVGLSQLQSISLDGTGVRDLSPLSELKALTSLSLNRTPVDDISPLSKLTELSSLWLMQTAIADLTPLRDLTLLQDLSLSGTTVSDISPLRTMRSLETLLLESTAVSDLSALHDIETLQLLMLRGTEVIDLRPIAGLPFPPADLPETGLSFSGIPATARDPKLRHLSEIADHEQRTRETLAYLKTLPPWPEPLPWLQATKSPSVPALKHEPRPVVTAEAQIASLLRHALVTRVTAIQLARQIEAALEGVPATVGNRLPDVLQSMADVAEVLRALAPDAEPMTGALDEAHLRLRIAQLEAIVERLTGDLADERKWREAAEALAAKDGFLHNYRKSAGTAAGVATVGLISIGVPAAAVYFLGIEHPMVQAVLTVLGRLPKS